MRIGGIMEWIKAYAAWMVVGVLVACTAFALIFWRDSPEAKPATNVLAGEQTVVHPDVQIVTFKPNVKKKLRLPTPVQENERQQVTAATRVEPSENQTEVAAVVDLDTGRTELFTREIERPWMELRSKNRFGVYLGINGDGEQTVRAVVRHEFARTGPVTWAAVGMADMTQARAGGFVGIGAEF